MPLAPPPREVPVPLPEIVVFDLDGTLVDSAAGIRAATNAVLVAAGRRGLELPEVRGMIGEGLDLLLERAFAATGEAVDPAAHRALWLSFYDRVSGSMTTVYPGAKALLEQLSAQGCRLGLCTNKPHSATLKLLAALGLHSHFSAVLGGDAVPRPKPDPGHLRAVIDALGGGPAALVGDSPTDVAAARAAGVPIVLVGHGYSRVPVAQLGADAFCVSFPQVAQALAALP